MRVVHIILGKANPNRMNGVNKVVNSLATAQAKLNYHVQVWGITSSLEKNYPERNYQTNLFLAHKKKFRIAPELKEALASEKNAIFHIHGGFIPAFYRVAKVLSKANQPYIYTPHGAYNKKAMERSKTKKKIYFSLFEKYIANNSRAVHSIGLSEMSNTNAMLPDVNSILIPNGQNIDELNYQLKALERRTSPVFGFCGRIDIKTKGLDLMLQAFADFLKANNNQGELWIIGGGGEMEKLQAMAEKLKVSDNVIFWDKRFGEEKLNIMAQADCFLQPSRNEGLPGAVLESAGLGVPCIVSRESNMAGYIKAYKAGVGMDINTPESITEAMLLAKDKVCDGSIVEWKEKAVEMIQQQFSWEKIAKFLSEEYDKALMN